MRASLPLILSSIILTTTAACSALPPLGPGPAGSQPSATTAAPEVVLPPTWTPTPFTPPAPTRTPAPASTETPVAVSMATALQLRDLPSGFAPVPLPSLHLTPTLLGADTFTPGSLSISSFQSSSDGTNVVSLTVTFTTPSDLDAFNKMMASSASLVQILAGSLGSADGTTEKAIADFPSYGDATSAVTVRLRASDNTRHRMDLALFRQGAIGAYVFVEYRDGRAPSLTLQSAADLLYEHVRQSPAAVPLVSPSP